MKDNSATPSGTFTAGITAINLESFPSSTLLNPPVVAEALQVTEGTLAVWRCTQRYPLPFIKIGRKVRYRAGDVLAFIEARTRNIAAA